MADLGARDEFETNEDEFAERAVGWDATDDAIHVAARCEYIKLSGIKKKKPRFLERIETGGRKRKLARYHNKAHDSIIDDYLLNIGSCTRLFRPTLISQNSTSEIVWILSCLCDWWTRLRIRILGSRSL